jgi:hypothetical protein
MGKRSRLWAVLGWELPGSYAGLKSSDSYWVKRYPELAALESPRERARVLERAYNWANWRSCWFTVPLFIGASLLIPTLFDLTRKFRLPFVSPAILVFPMVIWLQFRITRRPVRRHLRKQLCEKGIPFCIECGYDLKGNESGRCPECGTPSQVRKARP